MAVGGTDRVVFGGSDSHNGTQKVGDAGVLGAGRPSFLGDHLSAQSSAVDY